MLQIAKQYRVLGAMAALGDFTVPELGRFSEVKERTVRSVLERHASLYEEVGKEPTGRRGGSHIRYRLTDDGDGFVRELLDELESTAEIVATDEPRVELPNELVAAEHTVLTEIPAAGDEGDRARLLALVRGSLESVRSDAQTRPLPELVDGHLRVLSFLIRLTERELNLGGPFEAETATGLLDEFVKISLSGPPVDSDLIAQVQRRLQESPLNLVRRAPAGMVLVSDRDDYDSTSEIVNILETEMADEPLEFASPDGAYKLATAPFGPRFLYLFPLFALVAPRERWRKALATMRAASRAGNGVIALDDHWNGQLASEVLENEARATYLPIGDLPRRGLVATIRQHLGQP